MAMRELDIDAIRALARQVRDDTRNGIITTMAVVPGPGAAAMAAYLRELSPEAVLALCALAEEGAVVMAHKAIDAAKNRELP